MHGFAARVGHVAGRPGEDGGDKAFHVRAAPAVQAALAFGEGERIAAPRLAINGDNVGMARQNDAALGAAISRGQRGEKVGFGLSGAGVEPRVNAEAA